MHRPGLSKPAWHRHRPRPGRGRPVIFLHGVFGSGTDWDQVTKRLDGTDTVSFDLPGHGRTALGDAPSIEGWADQLAVELTELSDLPVSLVGYSMGGRLALHLASTRPDLIDRLVLISTSPGLRDNTERRARARLDDERAEAIRQDFPRFLRSWYSASFFALDPELATRMSTRRAQNNVAAVAGVVSALSPGRTPHRWDALAELRSPVLVVTGARDAKYVALSARIGSAARDATLVSVPEVGHAVHVDAPEILAAELTGWLQPA